MIQLRSAAADDIALILVLEERFATLGWIGWESERVHRERLKNPDASYLVIERDAQPAGFLILCGLDSVNRSIELKRVAVADPGQGIGTEAIRQAMEMVFSNLGAHRFWLDVYTDNERARKAYRSLGFIEEGTMRECIWQGGGFRSLVMMSILEDEFRNGRAAQP